MRIASACICCASSALEREPAILMPFVAHRVFGWTPVEITPDWGLRTIPTGMAYPLCNSIECQDCGVLFLDLRLTRTRWPSSTAAIAARLTPSRESGSNPAILPTMRRSSSAGGTEDQEKFLAPHLPPAPRVLDWGGDTGAHTPFRKTSAALHVFDVSGQSVVDGATAVGRSDIDANAYDLIVLSHVLEHMPDPAAMLEDIASTLKGETLLYVEVPHEPLVAQARGKRGMAASKKHWHEHVNFFTEASLRALLDRKGFQIVDFEVRSRWSHANFSEVLAFVCRREG